jgi:hypothetical protein
LKFGINPIWIPYIASRNFKPSSEQRLLVQIIVRQQTVRQASL